MARPLKRGVSWPRVDGPWLAVVAVALALRLLWVSYAQTEPWGGADPGWYFSVASNLATGHGFTVALEGSEWVPGADPRATGMFPPGWAFVLAAVFATFGIDLMAAKLVNVAAGLLTVVLVVHLGQRTIGRRAGLLAGGLLACYSNHVIWTSTLFSDVFFTMWFLLGWSLLPTMSVSGGRHTALPRILALGLVIGTAVLLRGQALVLVPLAALGWLRSGGWRTAVARGSLVCLVAALVIAPWTVRNLRVYGSPILLAANEGYNLRIGHGPHATGRYVLPVDLWSKLAWTNYTEWEADASRLGRERAVEYALRHPGREVVLSLRKLYYLMIPDSYAVLWANYGSNPMSFAMRDALIRIGDVMYWTLLGLALLGAWRGWRLEVTRRIALTVALWGLLHVAYFGEPRFHLPLLPLLALLAGLGLEAAWRFVVPRVLRERSVPA